MEQYYYEIGKDPSPTPEHIPQNILETPKEDFILHNSSYEDIVIDTIQTILDYPKNELIISSYSDTTLYKCPTKKSLDARHIWKSAKIPKNAISYDIESRLLDLSFTYASLEIFDRKILFIKWNTLSNSKCQSTWRGFIRWILCATVSS